MTQFATLDLIDLIEDKGSAHLEHILAVTETPIEVGDTFYIGNYPHTDTHDLQEPDVDAATLYKVDAVNDIVEVDFLHYNIKASKIMAS